MRNLVTSTGQRARSLFQRLENRLKSTDKKNMLIITGPVTGGQRRGVDREGREEVQTDSQPMRELLRTHHLPISHCDFVALHTMFVSFKYIHSFTTLSLHVSCLPLCSCHLFFLLIKYNFQVDKPRRQLYRL